MTAHRARARQALGSGLLTPTAIGRSSASVRYFAPVGDLAALEAAPTKGIELRTIITAEGVADGVVDEDVEPLHGALCVTIGDPMRIEHVAAGSLEMRPLFGHRGQRHTVDATKVSVGIGDELAESIVDVRRSGPCEAKHLWQNIREGVDEVRRGQLRPRLFLHQPSPLANHFIDDAEQDVVR